MNNCPHCDAELTEDATSFGACPVCQGSLVDVGATVVGSFSSDLTEEFDFGTEDRSADSDADLSFDDSPDKETPDDETVTGAQDEETLRKSLDVPVSETVVAPASDNPDATFIPTAEDPDATFLPPSADPNATFVGDASEDDPAMMQTGIGQFGDAWSEAVSHPGFTDDASLKLNLGDASESRSTLVIQPRSMTSQDTGQASSDPADYDLIDMLGKGGMGVVYAARQASIDRTVAVKMLKPGTETDADARNKFLSEACVTGDLEHPNIVPIYDVGRDSSGAFFYAMKRVQGTPWKDVLSDKSLDENLEILMRVADAVAFAHAKGILHRDLKPENTMLGEFGEVLVMDWGLAMPIDLKRRFGGIQQVPDLGGTPAYMAPEMIIGPLSAIGVQSDVYLLGAILFEIVTGKRAHGATQSMNCIHAAAHNIIQPTETSGELVNIALKAMKTDPRLRYESVVEFQQAIRTYESHSESILLSDLATKHLADAKQSKSYEDYNKAQFGFLQAIELWDGNESAKSHLAETRLRYAGVAKQRGDFELGTGLLDVTLQPHAELHQEITEAARQRDLRQQRAKTYQRVGVGLAALLFTTVTGAAVWINSARNEAVNQKAEAVKQQVVAEENWQLAEERKEEVELEKENVEIQRDEANKQRMIAVENEKEALRQEEIAKDNAKEAKRQEMEALAQKKEAIKQKGIAEENLTLAQRKEKEADEQRMLAEQKRREAVAARQAEAYEAYVARIGSAAARIDENAYDQARELLEQCKPGDEDETDHRGWEWDRLWYLCQQASATFDLPAPAESVSAAWNNDGLLQRFAVGTSDGNVELRNGDGSVASVINTGAHRVSSVALSPDGSRILVGTDATPNPLRLYNSESGDLLPFVPAEDNAAAVLSVQYTTDGRLIVSSSADGTATVRSAVDGRKLVTLHGHRGPVYQAVFAPGNDSTTIVTVGEDGAAIVWTDETGNWTDLKSIRQSPSFIEHSGPVYAAAIAADGVTVATAGHDQRVLLWNTTDLQEFDFQTATSRLLSGEVPADDDGDATDEQSPGTTSLTSYRSLDGHTAAVRSLAFTADGNTLISAGHDNSIRVWNVAEGQSVATLRGHGQWIRACGVSPNGKTIITGAYDQTVRTWDLSNYRETTILKTRLLDGHDDAVLDAQFSGSSNRIVTASRDRTIRIWNANSGESLQSFREGHSFLASRGVYSPDGSVLATAAVDGTVRLWDADQGTQQHVLTDTGRGAVVAFSPDGKIVATGGPSVRNDGEDPSQWNARLWDVASGKLLRELPGHPGQISAITFSQNGEQFFCGDASGLGTLWNPATGQRIRQLKWHTSRIIFARFLNDGSLATAAAERVVVKWNVLTGTVDESRLLLHDSQLKAVDVDAEGRFAATVCRDNSVRLWDWTSGKVLHTLRESTDSAKTAVTAITGVALSPDRQQVAIADAGQRIVRVYGTKSGKENSYRMTNERRGPFLQLPAYQQLQSVRFSRDGNSILTVGGDRVTLWENSNSRLPFRRMKTNFSPHGVVASAAFSADGRHVISGSWDRTAVIWDAKTGKSVRKLTGAHRAAVNSAIFSPPTNPSLALTVSDDGTAVLWSATSGKFLRRFAAHTDRVLRGEFSPDGRFIVTASADGSAIIWKTDDSEQPVRILRAHNGAVTRAIFSSDGNRIATAGDDNTAIIWDAQTGAVVHKLSGHTASVNSVAFTADGKRLITASDDFHCKVWDAAAGKELLTLKGHDRAVTSVNFSPKKNAILTASHDGTAIVWLTGSR